MTQKELGLAIGFNERTADVRMAQFESGTRVHKEAIVIKITDVLKVNPDYLMEAEDYTTPEGVDQKK